MRSFTKNAEHTSELWPVWIRRVASPLHSRNSHSVAEFARIRAAIKRRTKSPELYASFLPGLRFVVGQEMITVRGEISPLLLGTIGPHDSQAVDLRARTQTEHMPAIAG